MNSVTILPAQSKSFGAGEATGSVALSGDNVPYTIKIGDIIAEDGIAQPGKTVEDRGDGLPFAVSNRGASELTVSWSA